MKLATDIPQKLKQQQPLIRDHQELDKVTAELHSTLVGLLNTHLVPITRSSYRTKTEDSMNRRITTEGISPEERNPFVDIHGIRLILDRSDFQRVIDIIYSNFPTPEIILGRYARCRDYSSPEFNPRSSSDSRYCATHLNFFLNKGARIAEVQLMTESDEQIANETREEYERKRNA